jgi:UDP-sugar pyrophosphorylase
LKFAGVDVPVTTDEADLTLVAGIPVTAGPRVILCPAFGITQKEILNKLPTAESVSISKSSSVVLEGHHLTVKSMQVNGALIIRAGPKSHVTVDGLIVENKGWDLQELDPTKDYPEHVRIRGYTMVKHETAEYIINEPGNFVIDATGKLQKV